MNGRKSTNRLQAEYMVAKHGVDKALQLCATFIEANRKAQEREGVDFWRGVEKWLQFIKGGPKHEA